MSFFKKLTTKNMATKMEHNGKLVKLRKGVPQGSPISPLLSNIISLELDEFMEGKTKSKAKYQGNEVFKYLRDKLKLTINREKRGIRKPINFQILGYGFVSIYRKGEKGKYQLIVSKKRWKSLKAKLKEITSKNRYTFNE